MKLEGTWKGYYQYGAGYTLPEFGQKVEMTVEMTESKRKIKGSITEDDSEFSVPHISTIHGMIEDEIITFVKKYPIISRSGFMEIEHEGFIDKKNNAIYGSWLISEEVEDEEGSYDSFSEGIWFLEQI